MNSCKLFVFLLVVVNDRVLLLYLALLVAVLYKMMCHCVMKIFSFVFTVVNKCKFVFLCIR